jgi:uncharacterized protein (TIGR00159 family)
VDLAEITRSLGFSDLLDIVLVAGLLYVALLTLKRTRTTFLLRGVVLLICGYVVAVVTDLHMMTALFQVFFTVLLVALLVLFRDEIRTTFERLLARRGPGAGSVVGPATAAGVVETLTATLTDFARDRIGALVVVGGRVDATRFVRGGVSLGGVASEPLLKSIFDTHSLGHDGAVLISGDRVVRFGCHLPLATDFDQLRGHGTRHAAALGISTRIDGLCLVVSEEHGSISVARAGELRRLADGRELAEVLGTFYAELEPVAVRVPGGRRWTRNLRLKAASLLASAVLWYFVVHEAAPEYRSFTVAVELAGAEQGLAVTSVVPRRVKIIVSAARRSFYLVDDGEFRAVAPLFDLEPGTHELTLTASDLELPAGLNLVNIVPRNLTVVLTSRDAPG